MHTRRVENVANNLAVSVHHHHVHAARDEYAARARLDGQVVEPPFALDVELLDLERLRGCGTRERKDRGGQKGRDAG